MFTPDANKSRYSCEVGRLNILSLLASFAREIHYTTDANLRHGRGFCRQLQSHCKMYSCFCKSTKMYIQLREPTYNHNYFVLHCCLGFSASARNDVTARASSWLVNAARISAKVQIFQLARKKRSIRAASRGSHTGCAAPRRVASRHVFQIRTHCFQCVYAHRRRHSASVRSA